MGGGGGSSGSYPGGGGGAPTECKDLKIDANIQGVDTAVIGNLNIGDVLRLELEDEEGPVLANTDDDDLVGSVTHALMGRLIECMNKGHKYEATVKKLGGGVVDVHIKHT